MNRAGNKDSNLVALASLLCFESHESTYVLMYSVGPGVFVDGEWSAIEFWFWRGKYRDLRHPGTARIEVVGTESKEGLTNTMSICPSHYPLHHYCLSCCRVESVYYYIHTLAEFSSGSSSNAILCVVMSLSCRCCLRQPRRHGFASPSHAVTMQRHLSPVDCYTSEPFALSFTSTTVVSLKATHAQ